MRLSIELTRILRQHVAIYGLVILVAMPAAALAETAYVTDNLRLGLHQAEDTSDRAFRTLESGQWKAASPSKYCRAAEIMHAFSFLTACRDI